MLGESLDPSGASICGVSMVMKQKGARVEVWMKSTEDTSAVATVGRRIRELNVADKKEKLEFRTHMGEVMYVL